MWLVLMLFRYVNNSLKKLPIDNSINKIDQSIITMPMWKYRFSDEFKLGIVGNPKGNKHSLRPLENEDNQGT